MELKWPKRSQRDVNAYFAGYEKQESTDPATGRKKTEYVYRGEYYIFSVGDEEFLRFRRGSLLRGAGAAALFVGAHVLGPRGTVLPYIGIPALLSIIPLIYFIIGLAALQRVKAPRMTIRQYAFGLERMENTLWILLALWAVTAGGELVYLVVKRLFFGRELLAAAMELVSFLLMLLQQLRQSVLLKTCVHRPTWEEKAKKGG